MTNDQVYRAITYAVRRTHLTLTRGKQTGFHVPLKVGL